MDLTIINNAYCHIHPWAPSMQGLAEQLNCSSNYNVFFYLFLFPKKKTIITSVFSFSGPRREKRTYRLTIHYILGFLHFNLTPFPARKCGERTRMRQMSQNG